MEKSRRNNNSMPKSISYAIELVIKHLTHISSAIIVLGLNKMRTKPEIFPTIVSPIYQLFGYAQLILYLVNYNVSLARKCGTKNDRLSSSI